MQQATILFNLYQPDSSVLAQILQALEQQDMKQLKERAEFIAICKKIGEEERLLLQAFKKRSKKFRVRILNVSANMGFAESLNVGVRAARSPVVVTLHQDCVPLSKTWLRTLLAPLEDERVIATVSKVKYPEKLWNELGVFTQAVMMRERGTITPALDSKGCAYRKKALLDAGLFNDKEFRIGGDDVDLYLRLYERGTIAYPSATVLHIHPTNLSSRLVKVRVWANGDGALLRKYGTRLPRWYSPMMKATPLLGIFAFLVSYPFRLGMNRYAPYVFLSPALHFLYMAGFWKSFISGSQTLELWPTQKTR